MALLTREHVDVCRQGPWPGFWLTLWFMREGLRPSSDARDCE